MDAGHGLGCSEAPPGRQLSAEEIEAYFSGPAIFCLYCGNSFRMLAQHLRLAHGVAAREYREAFGLPWSRPLVAPDFHDESRARALVRMASGKAADWVTDPGSWTPEKQRERARVANRVIKSPGTRTKIRRARLAAVERMHAEARVTAIPLEDRHWINTLGANDAAMLFGCTRYLARKLAPEPLCSNLSPIRSRWPVRVFVSLLSRGWSYSEIAESMGWQYGRVKALSQAARRKGLV